MFAILRNTNNYYKEFLLSQSKMENQNISKQDCGCSDGCCTPKKSRKNTLL
jgi:6-phosphogluconate dehydrogenase (decarboxylating)